MAFDLHTAIAAPTAPSRFAGPPPSPAPDLGPAAQPPPSAPAKPASSPAAPETADVAGKTPEVLNPPKKPDEMPTGSHGNGVGNAFATALAVMNVFAAKKYATEVQRQKVAADTIAGHNAMWNTAASAWQQFQVQHAAEIANGQIDIGPDSKNPEVQQLRRAVDAAWKGRVGAYAQYTMPDATAEQEEAQTDPKKAARLQQKHKKSIVSAVKAWAHGEFSPEMPELILQSQLNQMKAVKDPTTLIPAPAPKQVLAYTKESDDAKAAQAQQALGDLYASAPHGDLSKLSPENQSRAKQLRNVISAYSTGKPAPAPTKEELQATALAGIDEAIKAGKPVTPDMWRSAGTTPPAPGKPAIIDDRQGQWMIPTGADGQPVMNPKTGQVERIKVGLPKNPAAIDAAEKASATWEQLKREYIEANPITNGHHTTEADAAAGAWQSVHKGSGGAAVPPEMQDVAISNAISGAAAAAGYTNEQLANFAYVGGDGLWHLRNAGGATPTASTGGEGVGPLTTTTAGETPKSGAFAKGDTIYPGGIPVGAMVDAEGKFNNALRTQLRSLKMTPQEIQSVIGRPLYRPVMPAKASTPSAATKRAAAPPPPSSASSTPTIGETRTFNGASYRFDGTQWLKQ